MSEIWLARLEPYFAGPRDAAAGDASAPLHDWWRDLMRPERTVVVVGALQSGKSSLLNALLGAPVLPVRAGRGTGVVTTVRDASKARAVRMQNGEEEEIALGALASEVLVDLEGEIAGDGQGIAKRCTAKPTERRLGDEGEVEEVRIELPLPLAPPGTVLVDTPDLASGTAWAERADLIVMVLAADKILSARERAAARRLHDLLNGNEVYVINRIDTIEEWERPEVLSWARSALEGSGNSLVGEPGIFVVSAASGEGELSDLRAWLVGLLGTPRGETVVALSRLGILEARLDGLEREIRAALTRSQEATRQARETEAVERERERGAIRRQIAATQARLTDSGLPAAGEAFVTVCVEDTERALRDGGPGHLVYERALAEYEAVVTESAQAALAEAPITAPPFDVQGWILRAEVEAARHPASELGMALGGLLPRVVDGGSAGRAAGSAAGSWIEKTIFGVDAATETRKRIERIARSILPSLQAEAQEYRGWIERLLAEAEEYYKTWAPAAPGVAAAEAEEASWRAQLSWIERFRQEVADLTRDLAAGDVAWQG